MSFLRIKETNKQRTLTFAYLWAYVPVRREWKMMMVSSRSHTNTRSRSDSGPGDGWVRLRPRDLDPRPENSKTWRITIAYTITWPWHSSWKQQNMENHYCLHYHMALTLVLKTAKHGESPLLTLSHALSYQP